jgi:hypothetical protein
MRTSRTASKHLRELVHALALAVPFAALGFSTTHCGTDITDVPGAADASGGQDAGFGMCKAIGSSCSGNTDCCVGACTTGVCTGVGVDGGRACLSAEQTCMKGFDCCSATCNAGTCVGSTPGTPGGRDGGGTTGGICTPPAAACTTQQQCCSGSCQPVTGMAGIVQCRDACRADGVACRDAQDCCSLGCFGGVCAARLCILQSEACTSNAECCSNICNPATKTCEIDRANSTCRPTGETCNSGPQRGCCGATPNNDLCDKDNYDPPRCIAPPQLCKGQNATCTSSAECCNKSCDPVTKTCTPPLCTPTTGPCTTGADCCAGSCTDGSCDAPIPGGGDSGTGCVPLGNSCTNSGDCCSGLCLGGFCAFAGPR